MPYELTKSNGRRLTTVPDGQIDRSTTSLSFIGKKYANYGLEWNKNFLKLLENFSNTVPPANPVVGQLWFNSTSNSESLRVWNGSSWVNVAIGNNIADPITFRSEATFDGQAEFNDTSVFNESTTFQNTLVTQSNVNHNGPVEFNNTVELNGTLTQNSTSTFGNDVTVQENINVDKDLNVSGEATFTNVTVEGPFGLETQSSDSIFVYTGPDAKMKLRNTNETQSTFEFLDDQESLAESFKIAFDSGSKTSHFYLNNSEILSFHNDADIRPVSNWYFETKDEPVPYLGIEGQASQINGKIVSKGQGSGIHITTDVSQDDVVVYGADPGDSSTIDGGTSSQAATVRLTEVNGSGAVQAITFIEQGLYSSLPSSPATTSGGNGTGLTVNLTNFSIREASVVLGSNGQNYQIGDELTISGGIFTTEAKVQVTDVDSNGGISSLRVIEPGNYTSLPSSPANLSGGSGSNATVNLDTFGIITGTVNNSGSGYEGPGQPIIGVEGEQTNLDLILNTKGNGRIQLNYSSTSASTAGNFVAERYMPIKDSSGNTYFLPLMTSTW